jgi:hypothetical protein
VVALFVLLGMGCSQPVAKDDSSKLKAEIDSVRAELGKARAECATVRAELEKLKADIRGRPVVAADRARVASLPGRFAAAQALSSPSRRQEVLGKLAIEAADLGAADITRACIDQLSSPSHKQAVTYQSALRLARASKAKEAVELANTLTSPSQRQKALANIAEGRNGD